LHSHRFHYADISKMSLGPYRDVRGAIHQAPCRLRQAPRAHVSHDRTPHGDRKDPRHVVPRHTGSVCDLFERQFAPEWPSRMWTAALIRRRLPRYFQHRGFEASAAQPIA
jgi:hypothetical protein